VIVASVGVVLVEVPMEVTERTMIGAVFVVAGEALVVSSRMGAASPTMVLSMLGVIARVLVIVIMRGGGYSR
jgi:hypothetical protein